MEVRPIFIRISYRCHRYPAAAPYAELMRLPRRPLWKSYGGQRTLWGGRSTTRRKDSCERHVARDQELEARAELYPAYRLAMGAHRHRGARVLPCEKRHLAVTSRAGGEGNPA